MNIQLENKIKEIIKKPFLKKIESYKRESKYSPFKESLVGEKYSAIHSFVHSVTTSAGMSMFEQIAALIAEEKGGFKAYTQYELEGSIDNKTENKIFTTFKDIQSKAKSPDYLDDIEKIKKIIESINKSEIDYDYPDTTVDLFLKKGNKEYYIDITSPKPNKKEFEALKQKLLRWTALRYSIRKDIEVFPSIAFPFNPYFPKPYKRFSGSDLFSLDSREVLIQEEFWDWLAGEQIYDELVALFLETGNELREKLEDKINSM